MKSLNLADNQITDLTPLEGLWRLTELNLYRNQITDLTPLKELTQLKKFQLGRNKITHLPPDITNWWPDMAIKWEETYIEGGLILFDNPLEIPPEEIVKEGREEIQNYLDKLHRASVSKLH